MPSWLRPFTLDQNTRFTRTPDHLLRPREEPQPQAGDQATSDDQALPSYGTAGASWHFLEMPLDVQDDAPALPSVRADLAALEQAFADLPALRAARESAQGDGAAGMPLTAHHAEGWSVDENGVETVLSWHDIQEPALDAPHAEAPGFPADSADTAFAPLPEPVAEPEPMASPPSAFTPVEIEAPAAPAGAGHFEPMPVQPAGAMGAWMDGAFPAAGMAPAYNEASSAPTFMDEAQPLPAPSPADSDAAAPAPWIALAPAEAAPFGGDPLAVEATPTGAEAAGWAPAEPAPMADLPPDAAPADDTGFAAPLESDLITQGENTFFQAAPTFEAAYVISETAPDAGFVGGPAMPYETEALPAAPDVMATGFTPDAAPPAQGWAESLPAAPEFVATTFSADAAPAADA
ncbi:hypothetical protein V5F61_15675, partial [Xanthobacter sp. V8C-5]